jgi:hypothetical protein
VSDPVSGISSERNQIEINGGAIGLGSHINCSRGASLKHLNLRVAKVFDLPLDTPLELIGEVFNLTNAINPSGIIGRFNLGTVADRSLNPHFMEPTAGAGSGVHPRFPPVTLPRTSRQARPSRSLSDPRSVRRSGRRRRRAASRRARDRGRRGGGA